jgi:hypothetical protein
MDTSSLAEIRDQAPHIRPRSAEIEAARRVPRELWDQLGSRNLRGAARHAAVQQRQYANSGKALLAGARAA